MKFVRVARMALIVAATHCVAQESVAPGQPAAGTSDDDLVRKQP